MIIIAGAGISGLTVAQHLEGDCILLEKENVIGGLSTQYQSGDYWFDYSGHYFHFQDKEEIRAMVENICSFRRFKRTSKSYVKGHYVPFPVQYHLSHLPAALRNQIVAEIMATSPSDAANLHDYLAGNFGQTLFNVFFQPFLSKYYGVDLHDLISNMDRGSIPPPDRERILAGIHKKKITEAGYNPVFYYPRKSLRGFITDYAAGIDANKYRMNERLVEVDVHKRSVKTTGGSYRYDSLVTSIPLRELVSIIRPQALVPDYREFRHISTLVANVVLKRKRKRFHWVYVADKKLPFYRVGFYPVHDHAVCYLERTVSAGMVVDKGAMADDVAHTLKHLGLIEDGKEVQYIDTRVIPVSYILFSRNWWELVPGILKQLREHGIYSIGRYGTWNYSSMSDDIKMAMQCAMELNASTGK